MSTDKEFIPQENNREQGSDVAVAEPRRKVDRFRPHYTSEYSEDHWEVRVSLPGVAREDLKISIENEILEVEGLRKADLPEGWKRLSGSDADRRYELKLDVGPEVDDTKIEANLKNGELLIQLPLRDEAKPRRIPIN